jgi:hypothetical protein
MTPWYRSSAEKTIDIHALKKFPVSKEPEMSSPLLKNTATLTSPEPLQFRSHKTYSLKIFISLYQKEFSM